MDYLKSGDTGNNTYRFVTGRFIMQTTAKILAFCAVLALSACATTPTDPTEYAKYRLAQASKAKDGKDVRDGVHGALSVAPGPWLAKDAFSANPDLAIRYVKASEAALQGPYSAHLVERERDNLVALRDSGALLSGQIEALLAVLNNASARGNADGTLPFTLKHDLNGLAFAQDPRHKKIIVDRTLERTIHSSHRYEREVSALMTYAADSGTPSSEKARIQAALPEMRIRKDEIPAVMAVFPAFAQRRLTEVSTKGHVIVKGMDRLEADDLAKILVKQIRGVEWVTVPDDTTTVVTIEKIRHTETQAPASTETIRYAQYQVNLLAAALLMPRNASYLYDVTSNTSELEYGYAITASLKGKQTYDNLLRGTLRNEAVSCSGARIQNVFGGVSPAEFVANNDQTQRCSSGSSRTGMQALREDLNLAIAADLVNIPAIKVVHEAN